MNGSLLRLKHVLRRPLAYGVLKPDKYEGADGVSIVRIMDVAQGVVDETSLDSISPAQSQEFNRTLLSAGDLVCSVVGTIGETFITPHTLAGANLSRALARIQLNRCANPRYVQYVLQSPDFHGFVARNTDSTAQNVLNLSTLANVRLPVADLGLQQRIANFLDEQTARIDALIAEKTRLLELLAEQRLSVAERVLEPAADGSLVKLGFFVDLLPGFAFPSDEFSQDPEDIPLLRGINVTPEGLRWDEAVYWRRQHDANLERFKLQTGDVVFGMDRPWIAAGARVAMVDAQSTGALLLQRVCRLRGGMRFQQRFLYFALASDAFRQSVEVELTGVSVPHISPEQILRFRVPAISPTEQALRCQEADVNVQRLSELAAHTGAMLNSLREYRSSLISAAVTGQLDISTFKEAA